MQTYNNLDKDGLPACGGFSNSIVVNEDLVHHISEKLPLVGVAPLSYAVSTTYLLLKKCGVGRRHTQAVMGFGRLGHIGVKFGVAFGGRGNCHQHLAALSGSGHQKFRFDSRHRCRRPRINRYIGPVNNGVYIKARPKPGY